MSFILKPPTFVVCGGPSTGKTTTIKLLEAAGFLVAHEEARRIINEGQLSPVKNWDEFQREVIHRQLAAEAALITHNRPIIADRGIFDNVAYWKHKGRVPADVPQLLGPRYAMAFLLEPLGVFEKDYVRNVNEDLQFTIEITPLFEEAYRERGVPVIRVPFLSPEERVALILRHIQPAINAYVA